MRCPLDPAFLEVPLAHRALHDVTDRRPENSRAAIRAAIAAGYGIEIDVQASRDAQAMVFHDAHLERLASGTGRVRDHTAAALADIELRGGDEGVPGLPEILELVAGRVPLLIEIKDQHGAMGPVSGGLERAVAQAVALYEGPVAVMSFNPYSVGQMARLAPQVTRGLVTCSYDPAETGLPEDVCDRLREVPDYDLLECSFVSHDRRDLDRARVDALKAAGAHVLCWTVKSPAEEAQARNIAENITFEQYLAPL